MDRKILTSVCLIGSLIALAIPYQNIYAQTTSPFTPPDEELGTYVVNSGPGLDTGCTFRSGGPLVIRLEVPTVVNPDELFTNGFLRNPQKLVSKNVIGAQAILRFPVFDIDSGAVVEGIAPEVDRVSFNGRFKKVLAGINNTWTDDSIVIPIEEVKFGTTNEIRIDIDTANTDGEYWCMAVDWVAIKFDVAVPYVLAHGINAQADTWDEGSAPGVLQTLNDTGVLYERFSVAANGRSAANAGQLEQHIKTFLEPLKSKKVHIIAHSKGGLDSQALQARGPEFEILSLSTLSTPHLGSVAADLSLIQKTEADDKINSGADPHGFASDYINTWTFGQGPQLPGLLDLTIATSTAAINMGLRGNIANTFTIGANADLNHDNELTANESAGLFPAAAHYAARRSWHVMRDFASAPILSIVQVPGRFFGTRTVLTYQTIATLRAEPNDIVVTEKSANPSYGSSLGNTANNHGTVKSAANIQRILQRTIPLR